MSEYRQKLVQTFLTASGIFMVSCLSFTPEVNAQLLTTDSNNLNNNLLIAQRLGTIQRDVEFAEVPATVLSAARTVSGGEPTKAQVQVNPDGSFVYELSGQNQQGFNFIIDITPDGEIIEIDEQVEASAVPEKVMKALKYWLPQAEVVSTWRSTRYQTFDYYYEIVISDEFWVEIPTDASTVKINPIETLRSGEN